MTEEKDNGLFYLWHLERIGLISAKDGYALPQSWSQGLPEVRVAIIDSGCATTHPNLPATAVAPALDVAIEPRGIVYRADDAAAIHTAWTGLRSKLAMLGLESLPPEIERIVCDMERAPPETLAVEDPAARFGAHGTACAGLIAARTLKTAKLHDAVLNYFGVNPFSTIIPVATGYNHEIEPLTHALLHAVAMGADVILLPRAVNDLDSPSTATSIGDLRRSRFTDPASKMGKDLACQKANFEDLLGLLAPKLPIVLAAGNDGKGVIAYPGSLVGPGPAVVGDLSDLIVVGAVNSNGRRSSYSSGKSFDGVAAFGPSDDEERIDKLGAWFYPDDRTGRQLNELGFAGERNYSPFGVLAIEVPGRLATTEEDGEQLQLRHLYSIFGGTSAASAIVAGLASLVEAIGRKEGKSRLTGTEFRNLLRSSIVGSGSQSKASASVSTADDDFVTVVNIGRLLDRR